MFPKHVSRNTGEKERGVLFSHGSALICSCTLSVYQRWVQFIIIQCFLKLFGQGIFFFPRTLALAHISPQKVCLFSPMPYAGVPFCLVYLSLIVSTFCRISITASEHSSLVVFTFWTWFWTSSPVCPLNSRQSVYDVFISDSVTVRPCPFSLCAWALIYIAWHRVDVQ